MALESFSATYVEARGKFLSAAHDANARICSYGRSDIRGRENEPLACDVAVLGAADAEKAAIVITGTHGVEGFAGSAILHHWLSSKHQMNDESIKVVLVHAINPWAFSHKTRCAENSVDLNRNFLLGDGAYQGQNVAYDKLAPFLHTASFSAKENLSSFRTYKTYLDQHGWSLENEAWAGQSHRPDGLFYTGNEPAWSNRTFRRIVNEHLLTAATIGFIDWHTGVGSFGEVVYLIFDEPDSAERMAASRRWGCDEGQGEAFNSGTVPKYEGLLCKAIRQEVPSARIAGAVIEFGTGDASSVFRADRLDRWLSFEGREDACHDLYREDYKNACCPIETAWRRLVLSEGPPIINQLIAGLGRW